MLIAVQILLQVVDLIDHSKFGHRFVSNISQKTPLIQWQSIKAPAQNINHPIKFIVLSHFLPFLLCNQLETVGMIKFRIYYNLACGTMADDWECLTLCSITNLKYYHWSNTFPGGPDLKTLPRDGVTTDRKDDYHDDYHCQDHCWYE